MRKYKLTTNLLCRKSRAVLLKKVLYLKGRNPFSHLLSWTFFFPIKDFKKILIIMMSKNSGADWTIEISFFPPLLLQQLLNILPALGTIPALNI